MKNMLPRYKMKGSLSRFRKTLQKKLNSVAEGRSELSIEFADLTDDQINTILEVLANPRTINGSIVNICGLLTSRMLCISYQ